MSSSEGGGAALTGGRLICRLPLAGESGGVLLGAAGFAALVSEGDDLGDDFGALAAVALALGVEKK